STWYSRPIADPSVTSSNVTKYFTPLLAPGVILNSKDKSKALYCSSVTIYPPLVDSPPSEECTYITPFPTVHPFSGKLSPWALLHPSESFPLNNNVYPASFSDSVNSFLIRLTT